MMTLSCNRCGHTWLRRSLTKLPQHCPNPKCHSPYFNRPRVRPIKEKLNET